MQAKRHIVDFAHWVIKVRSGNLPLILTIVAAVFTSCGEEVRTSKDLSREDQQFIQRLGILDDSEEIILFASQGGGFEPLKTAGNFFTDKRIAAYWMRH